MTPDFFPYWDVLLLVTGAVICGWIGIWFSRWERRRDAVITFKITLADIAALPMDRDFHATSCRLIAAELNRLLPLLKPKRRP